MPIGGNCALSRSPTPSSAKHWRNLPHRYETRYPAFRRLKKLLLIIPLNLRQQKQPKVVNNLPRAGSRKRNRRLVSSIPCTAETSRLLLRQSSMLNRGPESLYESASTKKAS